MTPKAWGGACEVLLGALRFGGAPRTPEFLKDFSENLQVGRYSLHGGQDLGRAQTSPQISTRALGGMAGGPVWGSLGPGRDICDVDLGLRGLPLRGDGKSFPKWDLAT